MIRTYGTLGYRSSTSGRGAWTIAAEPHVMIRLKRVLPRVQANRTGTVEVVDTPDMAAELDWFMARFPLDIDVVTRKRLTERLAQHQAKQAAVANVLAGNGGLAGLMDPARPPRPYQEIAVGMMRASGRMILGDELGLGKAQPLDAPVLTPIGYRSMGDIVPGDLVIGADGKPTRVVSVHPQGELDCYRVTFSDGATVECNDEHLWRVRPTSRLRSKATGELAPIRWTTRTLRELLDRGLLKSTGQAKWHIPMVAAPDLACGGARPIDPYLLGVLLGDGGLRGPSVRLTTADAEIIDLITPTLPASVEVRHRDGYNYELSCDYVAPVCSRCSDIAVARGLCQKHYNQAYAAGDLPASTYTGRNPVAIALRDLGLWGHLALDKFVPAAYRLAPADARLSILQGLMDTDGYAMPLPSGTATAQFYSSSRQLAEDVRWLAESLGGTGRISSKFFEGRDRFTVTVKLPQPLNPFRMSRKASVWGDGHASLHPTRAIVSAELIGRKPMQCIEVEHPDHLYIADRFVVTHNTASSLYLLDSEDTLPALVVTQTHLTQQWMRELGATWPMLVGHVLRSTKPYDLANLRAHRGHVPDVIITSYSKVAGWADHLAGKVRTVILDECQELRNGVHTAKGQAVAQVADQANYVVGLSATPVYNLADEIWEIFSVIAPDALGSRTEFLREWGGADHGNGRVAIKDPAALGAYLRDQGLFLRRDRAEVKRELPAKPIRVRTEIDADTAALDQLADDTKALARLILDQGADRTKRFVAAGTLDAQMRQATGIGKAPYVAGFVKMLLESEERVLLFGWHRACYDIWAEKLADVGVAFYTGDESPAQKRDAVDRFVSGDARVLVMSLRSGAGLDGLQEVCSVAVFGEMDWSPAVHDQAIGRLARDGQQRAVVAYFPVSMEGTDPVMDEVLALKRGQAEPIRDPNAPILAPAGDVDGDRVRLLAERILGGGQRMPVPA